MALGKKTGGRKKGTPNKNTIIAKDMIAEVAERLGGTDRMVKWAKEDPRNESAFWTTIYPKMLPLQLTGDAENPVAVVGKIELVALSK